MTTLLVCCGALPAHVEHLVPTFREAMQRGWELWFAVEGYDVGPYLVGQGFKSERIIKTGGAWAGKVLRMPQADWLFGNVKPDAVLTTPSGHGYPGGAWLEEAWERGLPAMEGLNDCYPLMRWYGKKQRKLLSKYLKALKSVGYGLEMHKCLIGTDAQRWVGLPIGDRLFEGVTADDVRRKLGLESGQEYVLVAPPWTKSEERAAELSADLWRWVKMAQEHDKALVMSLHPNARYAIALNAAVEIPKSMVVTSCWPGEIWGRPIMACPTMPLIQHAAFVIHTYRTGHVHLCIAAKAATWMQHEMHPHSRKWTEETLRQVVGNERPPVGDIGWKWFFDQDAMARFRALEQTEGDLAKFRPHFNLPCYYRGEDELEALFAGELRGYRGGENAWESLSGEYRLKVDGEAAGRIVDLLEL